MREQEVHSKDDTIATSNLDQSDIKPHQITIIAHNYSTTIEAK